MAAELRRLRADAGLSREQVAEQTGVNEGTLYRIETARARPQRRTLIALLDLYSVGEPMRADLIELSRSADGQGWSRPYQWQLPGEYAVYISFEAEARAEHNYESLFIPGLLQTPEYSRAMSQGVLPAATEPEIDERVQARIERQKLLDGPEPLQLWAVVDEAAVRRVVGGRQVMAAQLEHVLAMMKRPNVTVQVIPFDAGAHPGMPGSFIFLEFRDEGDPELVYVDAQAGDMFLESEDDLRRYRTMFDHLRASALSPARSADLIASVKEGRLE
ncbi:helix-turn-helix transcriptional regulator [Trebonia sp.]|uniref:helix-turn-helix domain-containing protein n=1 Tax=Trebonia sp. TaxID=2767075 RepID=UPI002632F01D|nr:helix-turn-helix transcriptional regulator [Trebonia sp.]